MGRRKRSRKSLARVAAEADGLREPGRFSARRKTETILRMLRGEPLDSLARELGVTAATLAHWREQFLSGGQAALKSRPADRQGRGDPAPAGEGRRDHHEQRTVAGALPPAGGDPAFTATEAERIGPTCSPSAHRRYGLARVCRMWELPRSTLYRTPGTPDRAAAARAETGADGAVACSWRRSARC